MSTTVKNTEVFAIEIESSEGVYEAPAGATSYVQTLRDGSAMNMSKETIARDINTGSIGAVTPRAGTRSTSGTIATEFRANSSEGVAPETDKLLQSALGAKRTIATTTTTKASGNTASVLHIEDADISKFSVGDIIKVRQAGAHHVSPIVSKTSGAGTATITLLIPHPSGDMTDSVVICKAVNYVPAEDEHPTLSITKYLNEAVEQQAIGCRVNKVDLSDFETSKIPKLTYGFEGLDFDKSLNVPTYTPSFDGQYPPIALDAKLYQGTTEIDVNSISLSIELTLGFKTAFSSANGRISSRVVNRIINGSFNPYQEDDDVSDYTKFRAGTEFSLFAYAKNDTAVAGEFEAVVAIYLPKVTITETAEQEADGLVQNNHSFSATRGAAGTTDEITIAFI